MKALLLVGVIAFSTGVAPMLASEAGGEWRQLFNGRNLDGWLVKIHGHEVGDNYRDTYRVADGVLQVRYDRYDEGGFGERYGHLFYEKPFSSYDLAVEYRFVGDLMPSAPGYARLNSGVMLHAQDPRRMPRGQNWPISIEFQFLAGLPDGNPRATGNVCTPGTHVWYDGKLREDHILPSSGPTFAPDEWVRIEAQVRGDEITHFVNGEEVLHYSKPVIGGPIVDGYDPAEYIEGKPLTSGYIALQAEGNAIDFRKVEVRELPIE
ncbi:hypothetical protein Pla108_39260 [Botrimarina colliarenosi]|uniref:3-keto-alpha-glucoside-1,2-lyase/3-keto-2-hydroxy-glucal hydratase domain-containing protein n=1 Tax=Botrimarina colliarenosi TaxID=2528001 RepID=A0A5C6A0S5_9BACT|nr:DUF1080 domain-containing protein [Botrimarina colliarenosi]TWT93432.1 hypothetical protein Pla108_39260 [Botrimarina colliarenosi]